MALLATSSNTNLMPWCKQYCRKKWGKDITWYPPWNYTFGFSKKKRIIPLSAADTYFPACSVAFLLFALCMSCELMC